MHRGLPPLCVWQCTDALVECAMHNATANDTLAVQPAETSFTTSLTSTDIYVYASALRHPFICLLHMSITAHIQVRHQPALSRK